MILLVDQVIKFYEYFFFGENLKFFIFNGLRFAYNISGQFNSEIILADIAYFIYVDLLIV